MIVGDIIFLVFYVAIYSFDLSLQFTYDIEFKINKT